MKNLNTKLENWRNINMMLQIFCVHDNVADAYLVPFFLHNKGLAVRSFSDCINDDQHQWSKNPQDYTLFHIGQYNDSTSELEYITPIKSLGNGLDLANTNITDDVPLKEVTNNATQ